MADTGKSTDAPRKQISKRGFYEVMRSQLELERSTFLATWRTLGEFISPRRPRFTVTDNNRGDRRNQNIIDSTATIAARTLCSGMMSGITSPARQWFKLTTPDVELMDQADVKDWLEDVAIRMNTIFLRSNLYNALPIVYGDMGVFGTSAMMVEEDDEDVLRFYPYPIGSYMISNDNKMRVRVFYREFRLTVRQLLMEFGEKDSNGEWIWENFSTTVKNLYFASQDEAWIEVAHIILPNDQYDKSKPWAKNKQYRSCYYERGRSQNADYYMNASADDNKFLRESGYDYFPVLCPRWQTNAEDAYGTSSPGIEAIGDVKALQLMTKRMAQAVEKMVNPAMVGPPSLRSTKASILPGDITYVADTQGSQGFRPAHEVDPRTDKLQIVIDATQRRIEEVFYANLFLMLANDERVQPATAREIDERHEEKLLALGPVLEQLNQDLLDPLIDITFDVMVKRGLIPEPPEQLQGTPLRVEYVSVMAQAQKLVGIASMERFAGFVQTLISESGSTEIIDKVDMDELLDQYGDRLSVPARIIRSDDDVKAIREGRAKAQQAAAAQQTMTNLGKTAKDLSQADTGGQNALTDLLQTANAGGIAPQK